MTISMIVGNWKMNTTLAESETLAANIAERVNNVISANNNIGVEVVVCPPFISLSAVRIALQNSNIYIGAQNLHHAAAGAYTGEVSAGMLIDICKYVIVGHSERRSMFGETDKAVNLKAKAALETGITPILCVGEILEERESGNAKSIVERQVRAGLDGVDVSGVVIAYEPVWAIGTGKSASPDIAQSMMAHIRQTLVALGGADTAGTVPLLYGGSVNAANIAGYIAQPEINGALVGGASLDAESFMDIVSVASMA